MDLKIDAEDAIVEQQVNATQAKFKVRVLTLPRISNHTDFDPLRQRSDIDFAYINATNTHYQDSGDLLIIPGSKNVAADLAFLRAQGWDKLIERHLRYGGKLIGICGGLQMLGQSINDPLQIESVDGLTQGLGLLPITTELTANKRLTQVQGQLCLNGQLADVKGYEIHCGISQFNPDIVAPLTLQQVDNSKFTDGMLSDDNQIFVSYLHGIFDQPKACQLILAWAGLEQVEALDIDAQRETELNRLATMVNQHLDMGKLINIIKGTS